MLASFLYTLFLNVHLASVTTTNVAKTTSVAKTTNVAKNYHKCRKNHKCRKKIPQMSQPQMSQKLPQMSQNFTTNVAKNFFVKIEIFNYITKI